MLSREEMRKAAADMALERARQDAAAMARLGIKPDYPVVSASSFFEPRMSKGEMSKAAADMALARARQDADMIAKLRK